MVYPTKLAVLLCAIVSSASACELNIVYNDSSAPPYILGDGKAMANPPGIAIDLVNMAAANTNCTIHWSRLPNRRVQKLMEDGKVDAMLMFSYSAERAVFANFPMKDSSPNHDLRLTTLAYCVYVPAGSSTQWDGQAFHGLNGAVGVNAGFSAAKDIMRLGVTVEEAPSTPTNLKKLQLGRIAGYVMQDLPADEAIQTLHLSGIDKLPVPFATKDYYLPFSKTFYRNSPEVVNRLWREIAEIRKTKGKELDNKYSNLH